MVKIKEPLKYKCKKPNFGLITEDGSLITYAKIECMLKEPIGLSLLNVTPTAYNFEHNEILHISISNFLFN